MRNVTMVVPVLITSCHVSLYPNKGPVAAQTITISTANANVVDEPETLAAPRAKSENEELDFFIYQSPF